MSTIILSGKGKVALPRLVRSKLHLAPGTKLVCEVQGNSVVLTPEYPFPSMHEYVIDPLTGSRVPKAR